MKHKFVFILVVAFLSGCSGLPLVQPIPTLTVLPTVVPTIIPSAMPVLLPPFTPTLSLESRYSSSLQDFSPEFKWRFVDDVRMAVLIPQGWVFTYEKRFLPLYDGFYVTQGKPDNTGRFSVGFTAFMYGGFDNAEDADKYAKDLLAKRVSLETTKSVLDEWETKTDLTTEYHLRIESEFSNGAEENKLKIIHYGAFAYKDRVYLWTLESPADIWDLVLNDYGIIFTHSEWFP